MPQAMELDYLTLTPGEIEDWANTQLQNENPRTRYNGNVIIAGSFENIGHNVTDLFERFGRLATHLTVRYAD